MLRLGKLTDYGTVLVTVMAGEPDHLFSTTELAARSRLGAATVAKLLRQLARGGLIQSVRGARGGYRLTRDPAVITVAEVVSALEGPIALTECSGHKSCCAIEPHCGIRGNWRLINAALEAALRSVTFAQMSAPAAAPLQGPARAPGISSFSGEA